MTPITLLFLVCFASLSSALHVQLDTASQSFGDDFKKAGMSTTAAQLTRWTNLFNDVSYTQTEVLDSYVPMYFAMAFKKGENFLVTGETSVGTPFTVRLTITEASAQFTLKPIYGAPILGNYVEGLSHMMWDGGSSNTLLFCAENSYTVGNDRFQWYDGLKQRKTKNCLSGLDNQCTSPNYATGSGCLGKDGTRWWMDPLWTGEARWGSYRTNLVDHYVMQGSCGLGGCTPPGTVHTFLQPWDPEGTSNFVLVADVLGAENPMFSVDVKAVTGLPLFSGCTLDLQNRNCDLDNDGSFISINEFYPPVYDTELAFFFRCSVTGCSHTITKRWLQKATIDDAFPIFKWKLFPGENCAMQPGGLGSTTFWPTPYVQQFKDGDSYWGANQNTINVYHTSDKGSNDPCGDRYTIVSQTLKDFESRTDELLYCDSVDAVMGDYTTFSIPYNTEFYSGSACSRYPQTGCGYKSANITMNSCQGGSVEFLLYVNTEEVVVHPPAGVDISTCVVSVDGYYNSDDGAVVKFSSCATSGPVKLQLRDSDITFSGGLTTVYATMTDTGVTSLPLTIGYAATTITFLEVYSSSQVSISVNLLDAETEFPPTTIDGGGDSGGDGFQFFRTTFGRFFGVILVICALFALIAVGSCVIKTNKAASSPVNVITGKDDFDKSSLHAEHSKNEHHKADTETKGNHILPLHKEKAA